MTSYSVIKIAIGIRMFPHLTGKQLAAQLKMPLRTFYTHYGEAEMYARSWIPNLVTAEQLVQLSGAELTVLHYLYTAEPNLKISAHAHNLGMSDKTLQKSLRKLRQLELVDTGVSGKLISCHVKKIDPPLAQFLN